mgnify:CR=1 FL=1
MPNFVASIAAATAILGYDLFTGQVWARSPVDRTLEGLALKGSAAGGDTEVEFYIDEIRVADMFNNTTGFPNNDDLLPLESLFIPEGALLRALVRDAPATNPINVLVAIEEV